MCCESIESNLIMSMNIVKFPKLSRKLRVMVLTLDNDHAERMTSYLEAFGVIHIQLEG
jgi:hypothetical protein